MVLCAGNLSECFRRLALPVGRADVRGVKNVAVIEGWTMLESLFKGFPNSMREGKKLKT